ncbi:MAG: YitT family protein [Chloroflexi bacterium]|nr:MAG: YitT family protein [Chloroflexota bacterium]
MKRYLQTLAGQLNFKATAKEYLLLTAGALILAVNMNIFMIPANIAPGGVAGIALIINQFTGWPVGTTMLVLNIPMLVLGFNNLGRFRFLTRTLYVVLVYNLGVDILAQWLPAGITHDLLLNTLYTAVVGGLGSGLIFRARGTSAGTGVLGRVIQLKTGIPVSQVYLLTDGGVILALGMTFGWDRALYSLIALFIWGLATDYVLEGPSVVRTVFIVTDQAEAVAATLLKQLGLGVTAWTGEGMFTRKSHTVLFCTLSRPDVKAVQQAVHRVDPHAFIAITHGHQVKGGVIVPVKG